MHEAADKRIYTFGTLLIKYIVEKYYYNTGNAIKSLTKNKFNMFVPNLKELNMPYTDINFIKMIKEKENNYAAVKNFTTYCLNDFINHQANNKKKFKLGLQLCVDIIKKMVEIQEGL